MNPPVPNSENSNSSKGALPLAGFALLVTTIRKRTDFLAARNGRHAARPGLIVQARKRHPDETNAEHIRVGFTCSKKLGNAVQRNRAKRRLREVAWLALPQIGRGGWDYVLIGRQRVTENRNFKDLQADFESALAKIHEGAAR